jgi:hypothetical protein
MEGVLAIILVFGGGTAVLLSFSPVGRALADRIRRGPAAGADPELLAEVETLRHDLTELQERVDFAERLLVQGPQQEPLRPGGAGGPTEASA